MYCHRETIANAFIDWSCRRSTTIGEDRKDLKNIGQLFEPQRPQSFYTEITEKSLWHLCFFLCASLWFMSCSTLLVLKTYGDEDYALLGEICPLQMHSHTLCNYRPSSRWQLKLCFLFVAGYLEFQPATNLLFRRSSHSYFLETILTRLRNLIPIEEWPRLWLSSG